MRQSVQSSKDERWRAAEDLCGSSAFEVEVTLGEIHVGGDHPLRGRAAPGVVEKISGLDKNIALGMRAQSVHPRPIPGKAAVSVEVPNQKSTPVGLREIIESEMWARPRRA